VRESLVVIPEKRQKQGPRYKTLKRKKGGGGTEAVAGESVMDAI